MTLAIRPLDVIAVVIYLLAMIAIGIRSARRTHAAENYFVGRRNFPGWVVALSMLGTIISSTTFLALPAAAYVLDWRQLTVNLVVPFIAVIAVVIFIPFFRRGGLTSAFEYLGDRFGVVARTYGMLSFVFLQLIRVAQVLFLVSLPLQFLTGAPLGWVIVGAGIFVALYTVAGGMETVVWAGAVQAIIMLVGGALCLGFVVLQLPGGFAQVIAVGQEHNKFSLGALEWNVHQRTFWTVLILGIINWLNIYSGEQTLVQRYVSASSLREARKATLLFSGIAVPMWTTFFFIGTALFVFFKVRPDAYAATLQPDQVLPYFVLKHIPAGLAGVVIAAVIAAAMSSLDSGVNSIATVVVIDLLKPHLARGRSDAFYLRAARHVTAAAIGLMTAGAYTFSQIEKESMNDVSLIVFSVLGGAITGVYMLGFFTRRVDGFAVNVALACAVALNLYLGLGVMKVLPEAWRIGVHSYWVGAVVNGVFMAIAYGISLVRRAPPRDLSGLTVWTPDRRSAPR
ncbi:MAG: sodium/solute symporter [Verrucomicrobia bacterium]|nr:sodium/solute symporter [Verrucomicrobiota bacterium]